MAELLQCNKCFVLSCNDCDYKLLCDDCDYKPCSICNKLDKPNYEYNGKTRKALILGYDEKPLCLFCKEHQCHLCGDYDGDIDWEVTDEGKQICDECVVINWCNECGGAGCDNRCPVCDCVCDGGCSCEVKCVKCGVEFNYEGWVFRNRNCEREFKDESPEFNEAKRICSDCWDKRGQKKISTPSWKNCKDCCEARLPYPTEEIRNIVRRENLTTGCGVRELEATINLSTLCDKCMIITPCSVCKENVSTQKEGSNRLEISNWDEEPICVECKKTQCYRCGNYNGNECDGNCDSCDCDCAQLKTWWGWVMCEECGMELCNVCRGECEHPCSACEKPCDADCGCSEDSGSESDSSVNEKNSIEEPRVCNNKYHDGKQSDKFGCRDCENCCHCGKVLKKEELLNYDKGGDNFRELYEWEEAWSNSMTAEEMKLPTCFACRDLSKEIDGDIFACWGCYNIGCCDYECERCGIWCDRDEGGEEVACEADGCEAWCVKCDKLKEGTPDRSGGVWNCKICEKMKTPRIKKQRQKKMSVEYVYGLENEALPGIVKIGGCKADPIVFLKEASAIPNPLSLPFDWKIVNSKRVSDLQKKLDGLYSLIEKKRIGAGNCFRIATDEFNKILDVIDGVTAVTVRSMNDKFKDKQVVRHSIGTNVWSGVYDSSKNVIVHNNESYKSPSGFALAHYKDVKSERTSVNGWAECQIEEDGAWVYIG